jgi:hypothetical protein
MNAWKLKNKNPICKGLNIALQSTNLFRRCFRMRRNGKDGTNGSREYQHSIQPRRQQSGMGQGIHTRQMSWDFQHQLKSKFTIIYPTMGGPVNQRKEYPTRQTGNLNHWAKEQSSPIAWHTDCQCPFLDPLLNI